MTLLFDGLALTALCQQLRAQATFHTTVGTVTHSVVERGSSRGSTRHIIEYDYDVDGRRFHGSRYCYGDMSTNGSRSTRIHAEYPAGRQVTVYYDPENPTECTLTVGADPLQILSLIFLTPFNVIMLTMWWLGAQSLRTRTRRPLGGRLILDSESEAVVRLAAFTPVGIAAATLAFTTFALTFVVAIGLEIYPSLRMAIGSFALAGAAAIAMGLQNALAIADGRYDLRVFPQSGRIALPKRAREIEARQVRFADIVDVDLELTSRKRASYTLRLQTRSIGTVVLEKNLSAETGENLREWLRARILHSGAESRSATPWKRG